MTEPGKITADEVKIPHFGDDDVLIKVKYCGICGTDVHIFNGVYSRDKLPLIPGHEFVGTIAAMGKNVKGWNEGDVVTADIKSQLRILHILPAEQTPSLLTDESDRNTSKTAPLQNMLRCR